MPSQEEPTNKGRMDRHQILMSSTHCAICNLTFGSQERRVLWGEKAAHPGCAKRVRGVEAA